MQNQSNTMPKEISVNTDNQVILHPDFIKELNQIKDAIDHTDHLASLQNIDLDNEQELEQGIKDLANVQHIERDVNNIKRDFKRHLNNVVNEDIQQLDDILRQYRFPELAQRSADARQLKKDLSAKRINNHWAEIEVAFKANINNYPLITQLAPALTDFNLFKLRHPKLVNGAKSWHFGDKQMSELNQDLYDINECLTDLNTNQMQLSDSYRLSVLNEFIAQPTKVHYLDFKNRAVTQMKIDAERLKATQENTKKQQTQTNQITNQQKQSANTTTNQTSNQTIDKVTLARQWLSNYTITHRLNYPNLANNNEQKTKLIYDLIHQLDNSHSEFSQFLQKGDNPDELELTVIKQILLV